MKTTFGARYQSSRRHLCRSTASVWAITFLSMYVFGGAAFVLVYPGSDPAVEHLISLMSLVMSAFIIAFSVLEQGKKHDLKAEFFLRCSQDIQSLHDKLLNKLNNDMLSYEKISEFTDEYNKIVHDFSDNHTDLDFRMHRIHAKRDKHTLAQRTMTKFLFWVDGWGVLIFAFSAPPTAFLVIYHYLLKP